LTVQIKARTQIKASAGNTPEGPALSTTESASKEARRHPRSHW
jgi:hypothetical protein